MGRMRKYKGPQLDAILLVDKPQEWTSHDVVNMVRRRFRQNKVGHCGTLDPMATGLLVVVIGKGTKLSQKLSGDKKVYEGTVFLGKETDSQDAEGNVTAEYDMSNVTVEDVMALQEKFIGDSEQVPPMVSALKHKGKSLHELAREGIEIERKARPITINELKISNVSLPTFDLYADVSKGTYIRTLAYDMGKTLGGGAHLCGLRRVASGKFAVKDAVTIEDIKSWEFEQLSEHVLPLEVAED